MDTSFIQLSPQAIALVPVIMALVSLAKLYIDSRWAPLLALVLGITGVLVFPSATAGLTLVNGLVLGLTAAGLYSGAAKIING